MKKLFKKILSIALAVIVLCAACLGFSGCIVKEFETEYFKCRQIGAKIELYDLTELGKEQEIIVVPETMRGKIVDILGTTARYMDGSYSYSVWQSDKLKKLFLTHLLYAPFVPTNFPNLKGIFLIYDLGDGVLGKDNPDKYIPKYIPNGAYDNEKHFRALIANVGYLYNYADSPTYGYYWIDDYAYGEKITFTPPVPERKGYKFSGWYKETECVNQWNFESNTLPPPIRDENEKEVYQELKLYAKWVKK